MKTETLLALICLSLLAPSLFGQTDAPAIPEEARKHFVMGAALAKDAKRAADFARVVSEFKQAVDLAPQMPQARYNLAKAREAAGDYFGAIADLKVYQQFNLSDTEVRMIQDKIYALEAKAGVAAKKRGGEQRVVIAEPGQKNSDYHNKIGFLAGKWNCHLSCRTRSGAMQAFDTKAIIAVSNKTVTITNENRSKPFVQGTLERADYSSIKWWATDDNPSHKDSYNKVLPPVGATPISVVVDKAGSRIQFETAQIAITPGAATWSMQFGPKVYTLTR